MLLAFKYEPPNLSRSRQLPCCLAVCLSRPSRQPTPPPPPLRLLLWGCAGAGLEEVVHVQKRNFATNDNDNDYDFCLYSFHLSLDCVQTTLHIHFPPKQVD